MFLSHVSNQINEEVTCHISDCVQTHKRTSDDIRQETSNMISGSKVDVKDENHKKYSDKLIDCKSKAIDVSLTEGQKEQLDDTLP